MLTKLNTGVTSLGKTKTPRPLNKVNTLKMGIRTVKRIFEAYKQFVFLKIQ